MSRPRSTATPAAHNADSKPFVWTVEPEAILAKVKRSHQTFETIHSVRTLNGGRGHFAACLRTTASQVVLAQPRFKALSCQLSATASRLARSPAQARLRDKATEQSLFCY